MPDLTERAEEKMRRRSLLLAFHQYSPGEAWSCFLMPISAILREQIMQEMSLEEAGEVGGGIRWIGSMLTNWAVEFTLNAVMEGKVGYTEAVEASGSGYCMLGA